MNTTDEKFGASFKWLNATQFLGAFNDNLFKLILILFMVDPLDASQAARITAIAGAVFVAPFLLFSALAGKLADSFSKRDIVVAAKIAELVIMTTGLAAFIFQNTPLLYVVLFLMAAQSAFFAPSKYGIVPELVKDTQISRANGLLEALTYLAIITGTASALVLSRISSGNFVLMIAGCVIIAVAGLFTSLPIERTPAAGAERQVSLFFVRDIWRTLWLIRKNRYLLLAVLASAYFLFIAAIIYYNLMPYGMDNLSLDKDHSGQLFIIVALGIGLGAWWAGRLSGRQIEFGIVPLGSLGLTFTTIGLSLTGSSKISAFILIFLTGLGGGLFIVPIHAFIQLRSPAKRRGQILAASNFLGWVGALLASAVIYLFCDIAHFSAAQMFAILGILTLVLSVITVILLPDFLVRLLCVTLTRLCYRIKISGIENVPVDKPVLLVSNHVSWVDALLIASTQQRIVRFVMDRQFYEKKWLNPICRLMKAIPISATDPPKKIVTALKQARAAMDEGSIVCIFAEGAMTRNGMLHSFRRGFERITRGSTYDIIPAYIGGAWGSIFSYYRGKPFSTLPTKFPYPVTIHFGKAMSADSSATQIRQKVTELSCDYFNSLKLSRKPIIDAFIRTARKNWSNKCASDSTGKNLTYGRTLTSAVALSRLLRPFASESDKVGILLPPSVAAVLANISVYLLRKVPVNLNYIASPESRQLAIDECNLKCIISSRAFLEKMENLKSLPGIVPLEDLAKNVTTSCRVTSYLKARFFPRPLLAKSRGFSADDVAAVMYSSGTAGRPKGIMLSHHNILSNIESSRMVFRIKQNDNVCGILPFFHSFGYNCTFLLPLLSGVSAVYCPNPLEGETVGRMARENRSTLIFATPTFLMNYTRRAKEEDFANMRFVMAGAEKLRDRVTDAFEAKFKIRPLEGYGATELSPVATVNLPDTKIGGVSQVASKEHTVGQPLPGVAIKIADIETHAPLEVGKEGLIMIKGPNVMLGYLDRPKEMQEAIEDGWYNTGDIGRLDEDGFLTLTDRLSRFSKIGGEMVSHQAVEDVLLGALETDEHIVAVTSVPDAKKGEELVVLYLDAAGNAEKLHRIVAESRLPNMCKPRPDNYFRIDAMPTLGSGKLNVLELKKIAAAKTQAGDLKKE